jgi:hypothetical protein
MEGPAAADTAAAAGWPTDGQLSEEEFEAAALALSRWWAGAAAGAPGGAGRQLGGGGGGGACRPLPDAWLWVRHEQPLTGEVCGYLAAEVLLPPAAAPEGGDAGAPPAAAPGAAAPRSRGSDDGGGGTPGLSDEEDAAAVPARPAAARAGTVADASGGGHLLELHIAYHPAYRVPLLLFGARRLPPAGGAGAAGGAALAHGELLALLEAPLSCHADASVPAWAYATQMPHPALGRPWAALHPCQTARLMALMRPAAAGAPSGAGNSDDGSGGAAAGGLLRYMVAWLSAVGRAVGVRVPPRPPGRRASGSAPPPPLARAI